MSGRAHDRQGGFILVEAIAVLLLSGMVMLTLLIATDLVTRNSAAATRRANAIEGLSTGLAALRRDITAASFVRAGNEPESPLLFQGGPRSLSFARSGDDDGAVAALVRVESRYEEGRGLLVRSEAPMGVQRAGLSGAAFGDPVVLLTGPWTYRLSYGAAGVGPIVWQESWTDTKKLPRAIRLEILDGRSGRAIQIPLVVGLKVDAEIRCEPSEAGGCGGAEGGADARDRSGGPPGEEDENGATERQ